MKSKPIIGTDPTLKPLSDVTVFILFAQEDIAAFHDGMTPEQAVARTFSSAVELTAYKEGIDAIEDEATVVEGLVLQGCSVAMTLDSDDEVVTDFKSQSEAQAFLQGVTDAEGWSNPLIVEPEDEGYDRLTAFAQPIPDEEYVAKSGNFCPSCRSVDTEGGSFEVGGKEAIQEVSCNECNATWNDVYKLVGYSDLETE